MKLKYSPSSLSRSGQVIHTNDLLDGEEAYCQSRNPSFGIVWWTKRDGLWYMRYPSLPLDDDRHDYYRARMGNPQRGVTIA